MIPATDALVAVIRRESPAVLAALVRISGDLDRAEDALQDALVAASDRWPTDGVPPNPGGWIMTTARRRLIDQHRRTTRGKSKERSIATEAGVEPELEGEDRLTLLFTCCHPALHLESRVALTLRTICGLTTEEIAAAFLVSVPTMAQRIVRAKNKIKIANIAYEIPGPDQWDRRLSAVLATNYLGFTRGHDLADNPRGLELADTAIDLARLLNLLIPNEPEIEGLLALMLLGRSRHDARFNTDGTVILFEDQDRARWNRPLISEAVRLVAVAPKHGSVGQYWLQAAIAAEHVAPDDPADRDWPTIVGLYDQLVVQTHDSPVVRLNRALAHAHTAGSAAALAEIDRLQEQLTAYVPFHAARGHLLEELDQHDAAANAYRHAIAIAEPGPQRHALIRLLKNAEES